MIIITVYHFKITPLTEQFDDPIYPVLVEDVPQGSKLVSEVVIFEHNRVLGKFDFGILEPIITHWPAPAVARLKEEIRKSIF